MLTGAAPIKKQAPLITSPLFLSEDIAGLADGSDFLDRLTATDRARLNAEGRRLRFAKDDRVFEQGQLHRGVFIIESGRVRVFYTGPSGRELTLAYWTPGNFIGGPIVHGGGTHLWTGVAIESVEVTAFKSESLMRLMRDVPEFAICLVEGLVAKAQCYTAVAQMLGTRSVGERLAQLLLNLADLYGTAVGPVIAIEGMMTHSEIASLVGATRQWVTMMLRRYQHDGIISVAGTVLLVRRREMLETLARGV